MKQCQDCPLGTYQPYPRAAGCILCDAGNYSDVTNATSCKKCAPGSYTAGNGAGLCTNVSCRNSDSFSPLCRVFPSARKADIARALVKSPAGHVSQIATVSARIIFVPFPFPLGDL